MSVTEFVIDLGERPSGEQADPPDSADRVRLPWRRIGVALGLLLLFTAVTASVPATPAIVRTGTVAMPLHSNFSVAGDLVVVTAEGRHTAYGLADGRQRWSIPSRADVKPSQQSIVRAAEDALLIMSFPDTGSTAAVHDPATGAQRWRIPNWNYFDDQVVMDIGTGSPSDGDRMRSVVRAWDLRTGGLLWSAESTGASDVDWVAKELMTVDADGTYRVRETATGQARRTGRLALPPGRPMYVSVIAGKIVVRYLPLDPAGGTPGQAVNTQPQGEYDDGLKDAVFDERTLQPIVTGETGVRGLGFVDCGPVWCVQEFNPSAGGELRSKAVSKETGVDLFRVGAEETLVPFGFGLLVTDNGSESVRRKAVRVVDAMTGHTVTDLTGWSIADLPPGHSTDLLLWPGGGAQTWIGLATADGVLIRGQIPHQVVQCQGAKRTLVCQTVNGQLGIWQVTG